MKGKYDDRSWSFLISKPSFVDGGIFEESVVFLLEDGDEGSFGIILNKDTGKNLGEVDKSFSEGALAEVPLFIGGPIEKEKISLAVWQDDGSERGCFSFGVDAEKVGKMLEEEEDVEVVAFMGFSVWSSGQLQKEMDSNFWIVAEADIGLYTETDTEDIWSLMLNRSDEIFGKIPDMRDKSLYN